MCTESIKETCTLCFYDMKDLWKKIKEKVRNIRKPKKEPELQEIVIDMQPVITIDNTTLTLRKRVVNENENETNNESESSDSEWQILEENSSNSI